MTGGSFQPTAFGKTLEWSLKNVMELLTSYGDGQALATIGAGEVRHPEFKDKSINRSKRNEQKQANRFLISRGCPRSVVGLP